MKLLINSSEDISMKAWMLIFTEVANLMLSLFNILNFIIYSQTMMAIIHPYFPSLVIHQVFILLHINFGDRQAFKTTSFENFYFRSLTKIELLSNGFYRSQIKISFIYINNVLMYSCTWNIWIFIHKDLRRAHLAQPF